MNHHNFNGKAGVYTLYRPGYPSALSDYLYGPGGLTARCAVADIGAGTGKFSRLLLERGSRVYGVDPNQQMLARAVDTLTPFPAFVPVCAPAEATTLADASVDFITVAQAFHWFDAALFRQECRRILSPGGKAFLIWNNREAGSPPVSAWEAINQAHCPAFQGFSGGVDFSDPEPFRHFFSSGCSVTRYRNDLFYSQEAFIGRALSSSYAPKEQDPGYLPYRNALIELFHRFAKAETLLLPQITVCYEGHV